VYNPSCFFINFSSAAVYGNPVSLPVSENMFSTPMSPYGWHKHFAEQVCKEYSLFFNIKICNLRIFSAYGPGLRKQFFWDLYNKFQKKGDIELYGTGSESRDFIYVDDITKCVELIIENRYTVTDNLNIATGIETTTSEAANIFAELLNIDKQITFRGEIRLGDPLNWRADINKIKSMGFNPSFTLKEGLKQYIEWLQKEKK
jgi:dTDP-glucose 4,6-dehydratase/UDP-glucose 4-epimerase